MDLLESSLRRLNVRSASLSEQTDTIPVFVEDPGELAKICNKLLLSGEDVAVDFEGVDLCRHGELCIVQLATKESVWIVDVHTMGEKAFDEGRLRELLESPSVLKIGYDGRADSDALFHLHQTRMANFYDLQITSCKRQDKLECHRDRFVHGLGKATDVYLRTSGEKAPLGAAAKAKGRALFVPEMGGSYDVWKKRPLDPALIEYAAGDVKILHKMKAAWLEYAPESLNTAASTTRIQKAINCSKAAKGRHMAIKDF
jgi:exonuclease 3'-5' domain-containing protein 1